MLEILWSLAGAIHLITHIVPNSKLAKWANKHISITITKD